MRESRYREVQGVEEMLAGALPLKRIIEWIPCQIQEPAPSTSSFRPRPSERREEQKASMAAHVTECVSVGNEYFKSGYRIQFGFRPPVFNGIVATLGHQESERVFFNKELQYLLAKRAIEKVPLRERESGYYSQFFIVSKKRGGLHSILDLRGLNSTLTGSRCWTSCWTLCLKSSSRTGLWW